MNTPFYAWQKITSLNNVHRDITLALEDDRDAPINIMYRGKVKLHGTNAAVVIHPNGNVTFQSRNRIITPEDDNMGFATWASDGVQDELISSLTGCTTVYYGEWCGRGIMKGTALNQLPDKVFAIYAMYTDMYDECFQMYDNPKVITKTLRHTSKFWNMPNVYVLPWTLPIHYNHTNAKDFTHEVEALVNNVETRDPWVYDTFGVEGCGEGLVFYPQEASWRYMFKAKGEKHRVVKVKRAAEVDPAVLASVEAFVEKYVTLARVEQGIAEACGCVPTRENTGHFLKWFMCDVENEGSTDLEDAQLSWKIVSKAVTTSARKLYFSKLNEIT